MAQGWDDGDEPWNKMEGFDPNHPFWKLPEIDRIALWAMARRDYISRTGQDSTRIEEFNDSRLPKKLEQKKPEYVAERDCFVATSAFENQDHQVVDSLRQYRDQVLANNPAGRVFIKAYYSGLGQAGAKVLDKLPALKPAVRKGLERLVVGVINPTLEARHYDSQKPYGNLVTVR